MQVHAQAMLPWLVRRLDAADVLDAAARRALLALPLQARLVGARARLADGDEPSGAHLIVSGIAYRYEILPDGARRILALYFPGDLCFRACPLPPVRRASSKPWATGWWPTCRRACSSL